MTAPKQTTAAPELPVNLSVEDKRKYNGAFWIFAEHPRVGNVSVAEVRSGCEEADELGAPADIAAALVHRYNTHHGLVDGLLGIAEDFAALVSQFNDGGPEWRKLERKGERALETLAAATAQDA